MESLYQRVCRMKKDGQIAELSDLTDNMLYMLYTKPKIDDAAIATMFNTGEEPVKELRKEYKLSDKRVRLLRRLGRRSKMMQALDNEAKESLMNQEFFDGLPTTLTHFVFRNGPIEDMHAEGKLSDADMKLLNKFMVDKFATLLYYFLQEERCFEILSLTHWSSHYGANWDVPEIELPYLCQLIELRD